LPLAHAPSGRCITAFSRPDEIKAIIADVKISENAQEADEFYKAINVLPL
jgi:hypothetical protein